MSCLRTLFSKHKKRSIPIGSSHDTHQDPSFNTSASKTIHPGPGVPDDRIQIRALNGNESPPAYSSGQTSTDVILANIVQSNQIYMFDAKGAFNVLRHRTVHVHLDCNYLLKHKTRKAIQLMAIYLLLIAKTFNCDMSFFFIGYPNKESPHLSEDDKTFLRDLLKIWFTNSLAEASTLVETNIRLSALKHWMTDPTTFDVHAQLDERHMQLLTHVQEMMLPYTYGWHQRDLALDQVSTLFNSAFKYSEMQSKCLNQVRFTFEREIKHYQRAKMNDRSFPFTALFLMGAPLHSNEVEAIRRCQGVGAKTMKDWLGRQPKQPGQQLPTHGHENEFQISTAVFKDSLSNGAIDLYQAVDNMSSDPQEDINDLTVFSEDQILKYLPHPDAWFKYLNCHDKRVDRGWTLTSTNTYGTSLLLLEGYSTIDMPTVSQVKAALHLEDLSDMDVVENDDFLTSGVPDKV